MHNMRIIYSIYVVAMEQLAVSNAAMQSVNKHRG